MSDICYLLHFDVSVSHLLFNVALSMHRAQTTLCLKKQKYNQHKINFRFHFISLSLQRDALYSFILIKY